jgi:hypothetical protein
VTLPIRVRRRAELDIDEAFAWYELRGGVSATPSVAPWKPASGGSSGFPWRTPLRTVACVAPAFIAFPTASTTRFAKTALTSSLCTTAVAVRGGAQPPPELLAAGVDIPSIGLGRVVIIFETADVGLPAVVERAQLELSVSGTDADLATRFWSSMPPATRWSSIRSTSSSAPRSSTISTCPRSARRRRWCST